ncbi:MAG: transglutaminase domain-containing protein [Methylococcales bacterium]|jgi:protein-glutamine gamma-glutamyltransferase|nr:transglutaminase domain-containing protein [Methylococcales bacterium]MBT7445803.1 transglutaminase domain-containing protein [Methylococcales bacterium]
MAKENSVPATLLSVTFLLWGWQIGMWFFTVIFSAVIIGAPYFQWRFHLSEKDLHRMVDITSLLFIATTIYVAITFPPAQAVFVVTQWLPVILFPLLVVQLYSNIKAIPLSALSMHLRRNKRTCKTLDMSNVLFIMCLVAASTGNQKSDYFFIAIFFIFSWFFWLKRNPRFNRAIWVLLMPIILFCSHLVNQEIGQFQRYLENVAPEWYLKFFSAKADPYHRSTALGYIGELKLSDRIMLRVKSSTPPPPLLRVASYNRFGGDFWSARTGGFEVSTFSKPQTTGSSLHKISIMMDLDDGEAVLPLPLGTQHIWNLPAETISKNPLGAVKVENGPDISMFNVAYDVSAATQYLPTADDLSVPSFYHQVIDEFIVKYGLKNTPKAQLMAKIDQIFTQDYRYTLNLSNGFDQPVNQFLSKTKSGHCEFFATSTVLILRRLGIPTRYASGFAVQEYSDLESLYVVRAKHAHAWALSFQNGHWQDVDTTPPDWSILDGGPPASRWITDMWSWLVAEFDRLRMTEKNNTIPYWMIIFLLPLTWFLRKKFKGMKMIPWQKKIPQNPHELTPLLGALRQYQVERQSGETLMQLALRAQAVPGLPEKRLLIMVMKAYYAFLYCKKENAETTDYKNLMAKWLKVHNT